MSRTKIDMREARDYKSFRDPIRPSVKSEDELQSRYPGLPPKEERFGNLGEFVSAVIKAEPP